MEEDIKKVLEDHEKRIRILEGQINAGLKPLPVIGGTSTKQLTLTEIIRGKDFKSGQEKIAVIVGYYEKIAHKSSVKESDLKEGWRIGKFDGKYSPGFLARAASWVRNIDSNLDLSQTGEQFFKTFLETK